MKYFRSQRGAMLMNTVIFSGIAMIITFAFVGWAVSTITLGRKVLHREQALQIAEAGIDYYRWHLAHAPEDFVSDTGVHDFHDRFGNKIGEFNLTVTPPSPGSTIVTVESEGTVVADATVERTIRTQLAIPSFAKWSVVANADIRFGSGTETFGEMHSNGGIRFDGLAHNIVTSAQYDYDDPDHSGGNEWGVHTHVSPTDPLPPTAFPARPDVFATGRLVAIPAVDFAGITSDLADMKTEAQDDGHYFAPSGNLGYHVVVKTNDTFDLYRVTSLVNPPWGCSNSLGQDGWGTWSISNETFIDNYDNPNNGIIFLEDNVWVDGQIDTARLTIASGRFPDTPSTRTSITFNNDLLYTNYDGQDVISLIAQKNINAGMVSEDNLRIDAALIAQNGRVGRYYYRAPWWWYNRCSPYHDRDEITLYGMIGTNLRYGFAYTDNTGYDDRIIIYDANLLYAPPPFFPLTSDQYQILDWEEIE